MYILYNLQKVQNQMKLILSVSKETEPIEYIP